MEFLKKISRAGVAGAPLNVKAGEAPAKAEVST